MIALMSELWNGTPETRAVLCLFAVSVAVATANLLWGGTRR
jgi:hypothetical protein